MDGTKPAMESNAEETQEEGQESKGTQSAAEICAFLWFFFPFGDVRVCASPSGFTYTCNGFSLWRDTIAVFFFFFPFGLSVIWGRFEKTKQKIISPLQIIPPIPSAIFPVILRLQRDLKADGGEYEGWWAVERSGFMVHALMPICFCIAATSRAYLCPNERLVKRRSVRGCIVQAQVWRAAPLHDPPAAAASIIIGDPTTDARCLSVRSVISRRRCNIWRLCFCMNAALFEREAAKDAVRWMCPSVPC